MVDGPAEGRWSGAADGPDVAVSGSRGKDALLVLEDVKDPEVPVLSVVELGIVRGVEADAGRVAVTITPTYSGCPAMKTIEDDVREALGRAGFESIEIRTVYSPAWTTDWIPEPAREKLRAYGIAPPDAAAVGEPVLLGRTVRAVKCPYCLSPNTALQSEFGSTACKSLYVCRSCTLPFEHFKSF
jgi:ring-1,2-phenylacetyl-CoA epoxidase subunit PaaD